MNMATAVSSSVLSRDSIDQTMWHILTKVRENPDGYRNACKFVERLLLQASGLDRVWVQRVMQECFFSPLPRDISLTAYEDRLRQRLQGGLHNLFVDIVQPRASALVWHASCELRTWLKIHERFDNVKTEHPQNATHGYTHLSGLFCLLRRSIGSLGDSGCGYSFPREVVRGGRNSFVCNVFGRYWKEFPSFVEEVAKRTERFLIVVEPVDCCNGWYVLWFDWVFHRLLMWYMDRWYGDGRFRAEPEAYPPLLTIRPKIFWEQEVSKQTGFKLVLSRPIPFEQNGTDIQSQHLFIFERMMD